MAEEKDFGNDYLEFYPSRCKMKKIEMSEKAYIVVKDLVNVHRAQDALREICQPNSTEYISEKDYQTVMTILAKWSDGMFKRIECNDDEA